MNIYYQGSRLANIESAIDHVCIPEAWSYSGQMERMAKENEILRAVLGRVVQVLIAPDECGNKSEQLQYILGRGYEVIE